MRRRSYFYRWTLCKTDSIYNFRVLNMQSRRGLGLYSYFRYPIIVFWALWESSVGLTTAEYVERYFHPHPRVRIAQGIYLWKTGIFPDSKSIFTNMKHFLTHVYLKKNFTLIWTTSLNLKAIDFNLVSLMWVGKRAYLQQYFRWIKNL